MNRPIRIASICHNNHTPDEGVRVRLELHKQDGQFHWFADNAPDSILYSNTVEQAVADLRRLYSYHGFDLRMEGLGGTMQTIRFTDRGPFYGCNTSGDQAGEYVRADVARELLAALKTLVGYVETEQRGEGPMPLPTPEQIADAVIAARAAIEMAEMG